MPQLNKPYFCNMSTKKFLAFGTLLALLLLTSFSVTAKTIGIDKFQEQRTESLNKTEHSFHKNMLQPQLVHVTMMPEHSVKPVPIGFGIFCYRDTTLLLLQPTAQAHVVLQDANRCESVSRFLFPYHFFW